ncbi:EAL domain-containing protein [Gammaproteobacteria bacterium AB-CW1]|uniref:EAL domain-containing protein n=1 Tax=Natronospira elongata TaxID=3110268 RepID=A0AAP6MMT5_9GAMM|nr:EAL domain-containing protein [Gammaproteobacteria bacterium AB-CW1]
MHFLDASMAGDTFLAGDYSVPLVLLSLLIAIMAAFASISHVDLMRATRSARARLGWHLNGALALGLGVWTMHFTGMVAFRLPVAIEYHALLTLVSVFPAVLAAYLALDVISRPRPSFRAILLGGALMGLGIGGMHYIGMAAMVMEAAMAYRPGLVLLSLLVAVVMSSLALAIPRVMGKFLHEHQLYQPLGFKLASATLMGLAISSLHYVAMAATRFPAGHSHEVALPGPTLNPDLVASLAVGSSLFILITSTVTASLRQRVELARLEAESARLQALELDERFTKIASRLPGVVYQFRMAPDGQLSFPYASEAIRDIYGVPPEAVRENADPITRIIHPDDLEGLLQSIQESAETMSTWGHEYRVIHPEHGERWLQGNALPEKAADGAVIWNGFITDITEQKQSQEKIHQLAFYDDLTGLPNRRLLDYRMGLVQAASSRLRSYGAILFIDLDDFKRLNDTMGHSVGDELLKTLARRLEGRTRSVDTVARLGGDEFVVILDRLGNKENEAAQRAGLVAEDIQAIITQPVNLPQHEHRCAASIGITLFQGDVDSREELLRRADTAMYQAKADGRNSIRFYNPELQRRMERQFRMEAEIRQAIDSDQFFLHLQKQVGGNGKLIGAEALLRWNNPSLGMVSPMEFIPVAEETGLILPLGNWVLENACRILKDWEQEAATADLSLSINVSARQFHQKDFVRQVQRAIDEHKVSPDRLKLELTESLVLEDIEDSMDKMEQLHALGLHFSMDDFGTGYSSMAYLSRLPFDEVKIDKSFVQNAARDRNQRDWVIIEAIIGLASNLNMRVVAEGVETQTQQSYLCHLGCRCFQGYFYGRPKPVEEFNVAIKSQFHGTESS